MAYTLLITGTVGVGKTSTAEAVGMLLAGRGVPHAVVDMDELRRVWPARGEDEHNEAVGLENLAAVAGNYRRAGARIIVVATVAETAEMVEQIAKASGTTNDNMATVRLIASPASLEQRIQQRHARDLDAADLEWHRRRAPQLDAILDKAGLPAANVSAEAPLMDVAARALAELEDLTQ